MCERIIGNQNLPIPHMVVQNFRPQYIVCQIKKNISEVVKCLIIIVNYYGRKITIF